MNLRNNFVHGSVEVHHTEEGLRDWFAGQALPEAMKKFVISKELAAQWAYEVADEMMEARQTVGNVSLTEDDGWAYYCALDRSTVSGFSSREKALRALKNAGRAASKTNLRGDGYEEKNT